MIYISKNPSEFWVEDGLGRRQPERTIFLDLQSVVTRLGGRKKDEEGNRCKVHVEHRKKSCRSLTGENEEKGKNPDGLWSWSREPSGGHRVNGKIHFSGSVSDRQLRSWVCSTEMKCHRVKEFTGFTRRQPHTPALSGCRSPRTLVSVMALVNWSPIFTRVTRGARQSTCPAAHPVGSSADRATQS